MTGDTTVIKTTTKTFHPDGRVQTHIKTETKRVSGGEQPAPAEEPTTRAAAGGGTKAEEDAAAQAKVVLFKVPDGAEPGTQVQAAIRGKKFPVTIPDGKKPGDTFEITIPTDGDPPSESSVHPSQAVSDETTPEASEPSLPKDALLSPDEWYTKLLNDRSKSKPEQESEIAATPDSEPAAQELESEPTAEASAPASGEEDPEARARWAWVDHLEGQCSPAWFGRHRRFPTSIEAGWLLGTSSVVLAEVASTLAGIGALANLRELQALFLVRQWRKNCARPECPVACRQTSSLLRAGGAV